MPKIRGESRPRSAVQRVVTKNVKTLMVVRDMDRAEVAAAIGLTKDGIGHKFTGRARWSLDDVEALSNLAGANWPVSRFFEDPDVYHEGTEMPGRKFSSGYIFARVHRRTAKPRIVPTPWGATPVEHRRAA